MGIRVLAVYVEELGRILATLRKWMATRPSDFWGPHAAEVSEWKLADQVRPWGDFGWKILCKLLEALRKAKRIQSIEATNGDLPFDIERAKECWTDPYFNGHESVLELARGVEAYVQAEVANFAPEG